MITDTEIFARFSHLERRVLEQWIVAGWLRPRRSEAGLLFDEADVARMHLLCDLCYDMQLGDEEIAMVVSLLDQLHGTRMLLRALSAAVQDQPQNVRSAIIAKMGEALLPRD